MAALLLVEGLGLPGKAEVEREQAEYLEQVDLTTGFHVQAAGGAKVALEQLASGGV